MIPDSYYFIVKRFTFCSFCVLRNGYVLRRLLFASERTKKFIFESISHRIRLSITQIVNLHPSAEAHTDTSGVSPHVFCSYLLTNRNVLITIRIFQRPRLPNISLDVVSDCSHQVWMASNCALTLEATCFYGSSRWSL